MKTEELTDLENMLDGELKCGANHLNNWTNPVCSGEVEAMYISCNDRYPVCSNSVLSTRQAFTLGLRHDACLKRASECWKIIPI